MTSFATFLASWQRGARTRRWSFASATRSQLIWAAIAGLLSTSDTLVTAAAQATPAIQTSQPIRNPAAVQHAPIFISSPGTTDFLLVIMAFVLIAAVLAAGVFFFWLHSLPERMVHNSTKVHADLVAVLALIALFTHIHLFWVAALLLALIKIPNFSLPGLDRIAASLETMAKNDTKGVSSTAEKP